MASLTTLPPEIVCEIAELLLEDKLVPPVIGDLAAWVLPAPLPWVWKTLQTSELAEGDSPDQDYTNPQREAEVIQIPVTADIPPLSMTNDADAERPPCSIKALRSTSRFFNAICEPLLYRKINLVDDCQWDRTVWDRIHERILLPKAEYIHTLSVCVDFLDGSNAYQVDQALLVPRLLRHLGNLQSLAIYYNSTRADVFLVQRRILELIERGSLTSLGIYSTRLVHSTFFGPVGRASTIIDLINALCLSPAAPRLRKLDILTESIPSYTFDLIRSHLLPFLTSFTIRRTLQSPEIYYCFWDLEQRAKWTPSSNLTRLQLSYLSAAHPAQIPHLVHLFPSLRELTVSACGGDANWQMVMRQAGWSRLPDSLAMKHRPLDWFHIEHMDEWEIFELGIIPTKVLMVTTLKKYDILATLRADAEIFPGLEVLRIPPLRPDSLALTDGRTLIGDEVIEGPDVPDDGKPGLMAVCAARRVEVRRDGVAKWICGCDRTLEGYY